MKQIAKYIAILALFVLVVPPVLYLAGKMQLDAVKMTMTVATVIWFITATVWMWKEQEK